ncbi:MAG: ElyC/SanA/YdcF family protein [Candidatus Gracilibacteria bacterium]
MKIKRKKLLIAIIIGIVVMYIFLIPILIFKFNKSDIFYKTSDIEKLYDVGIVFGAGIKQNGEPSDVLKDRLKTANNLYRDNKIVKILVSGDNRFENYNEPEVMKNYLVNNLGIEEKNIIVDYAGRRTYDTCIRARKTWGIENAILITQEYHLPRALFTCKTLGIESIGFSATLQPYVKDAWFNLREFAALHKAFLDVYVLHPDYIK